jgi:hypothetical protein
VTFNTELGVLPTLIAIPSTFNAADVRIARRVVCIVPVLSRRRRAL